MVFLSFSYGFPIKTSMIWLETRVPVILLRSEPPHVLPVLRGRATGLLMPTLRGEGWHCLVGYVYIYTYYAI